MSKIQLGSLVHLIKENKSGVVIHPSGRGWMVLFPDHSRKICFKKELEIIN